MPIVNQALVQGIEYTELSKLYLVHLPSRSLVVSWEEIGKKINTIIPCEVSARTRVWGEGWNRRKDKELERLLGKGGLEGEHI